ncbi:Mitogen-activated protein kinase kinase kinase 10 [Tetrabaena socialis]|uniref:Mitogen-activated protein kinase kinase kinase 10 n=1 Tax=Tetrabaena socialis TaxID=47790 RepID=A0A2J7ZW29_9CHLO|nr:Mitogen-activated protein kinase kinase kinase 10 [Tetrabaena socialis]|eukprot:PNH04462.1 Mitogen-activated protein kinase kinase kinase 10 [Tetrabaena socialis]
MEPRGNGAAHGPPSARCADPLPKHVAAASSDLLAGGSFMARLLPPPAPEVISPETPQRASLCLDAQLVRQRAATGPAVLTGGSGEGACTHDVGALTGGAPELSGAALDDVPAVLPALSTTDAGGAGADGDLVTLLPTVLGRGASGRVQEGLFRGMRVAVKVLTGTAFDPTGTQPTPSLLPQQQQQMEQQQMEQEQRPQQQQQQQQMEQRPQAAVPEEEGGRGARAGEGLALLLKQEVAVLGRCDSPHVVRLLAACMQPPRLFLVMELMETSLEHLLYAAPWAPLPLRMVVHIGAQVARGLDYIHPFIVHRDLKPANVLLNGAGTAWPTAKLADFGLARIRSATLPTLNPEAGTPAYMAPECYEVDNNVVTHRADMYSLGVLLWTMLTRHRPWEGFSIPAVAYKVVVLRERLPLSQLCNRRCPHKLRRLILQCWEADPRRRPAAAEALKVLLLVQQQMPLAAGRPGHEGRSIVAGNGAADTPLNVAMGSSRGAAAVQCSADIRGARHEGPGRNACSLDSISRFSDNRDAGVSMGLLASLYLAGQGGARRVHNTSIMPSDDAEDAPGCDAVA